MTTADDQHQTLTALLRLLDRPGLACFDAGERWTVVTWGSELAVSDARDWPAAARSWLRGAPPGPLPFTSGLVGWLGYEAGATVERMPAPRGARAAPDVCLWRAEGSLCLDRIDGRWHAAGDTTFRAIARERLAAARSQASRAGAPPGERVESRLDAAPRPDLGAGDAQREAYVAGVRAVRAAIEAGEVYQANLAWEVTGRQVGDPLGAWLALRAANPATRGAFLRWGDVTVVSNSPELFLEARPGPDGVHVESVPIKGTVPVASGDPGRRHLLESEKERAELTMIVDLVRNDLGRVAVPGSVSWGARELRRCGDLLHAEQSVRATLADGMDALHAVAASFPPGSVTGAPKVAAMAHIGRLEQGPRGIYTGALGWFGDDGGAHLSVAIRTATVVGGRARFHVGAGIVWDSEPEHEWAETVAKGVALDRALGTS